MQLRNCLAAFFKRSRSSGRLPDTFRPNFRSSFRNFRTLVTTGSNLFQSTRSKVKQETAKIVRVRLLQAWEENHDFSCSKFPAVWGRTHEHSCSRFHAAQNSGLCLKLTESVHEIGTANFVLGVLVAWRHGMERGPTTKLAWRVMPGGLFSNRAGGQRKGGRLGMLLACGQRRAACTKVVLVCCPCTKLAQRISRLGSSWHVGRGGDARFRLCAEPDMCWRSKR